MKLSIVMAYYQRQKQLLKTLDSFRQYNPEDFNVVIVDDNSPDDIQLPELPFEVIVLKLDQKKWVNPAPVFNLGFNEALKSNPDYVIIQNPECYHKGNILGYVFKHLTNNNYLTFGCYSLGAGEDVDLQDLIKFPATANGGSGWYNHSRYRSEALHFCAAITTDNLRKINGFDEQFTMGLGWEDNYLVHQVRTLGLRVVIVDDPFVFHQYHYGVKSFEFDQKLYDDTGAFFMYLRTTGQYRAKHLVTPDL